MFPRTVVPSYFQASPAGGPLAFVFCGLCREHLCPSVCVFSCHFPPGCFRDLSHDVLVVSGVLTTRPPKAPARPCGARGPVTAGCWPASRLACDLLSSGSAGTSRREGRDGRRGPDGECGRHPAWRLVLVSANIHVFPVFNISPSPRAPQVPPAPEDPPEPQVLTDHKVPQAE